MAGGSIVLLVDEADPPYERPPLSKDYLQGQVERDKIFVHEPGWYADHDVELRTSATVTGIDRTARRVALADGSATLRWASACQSGTSPET